MPHSSGGGSHRGGSHSGSHHSSSSGSSASRTTASSKPFPGAKRYVYYAKGQPKYVYADYDITKKEPMRYTTCIPFLIFAAVAIFFFWKTNLHNPKKIDTANIDTAIIISDDAGVISDRTALETSLKHFLNKTGIPAAVKTLNKDDWSQDYTLKNHAYNLYLKMFKDEKHWLIVYSSDPEGEAEGFEDWEWEGMQGNDTDPILGEKETGLFNKTLQTALLQREKYDVGAAIALAFDTLTPRAMDSYIENPKSAIWGTVILVALNIFLIIIIISDNINAKKYRTAEKCPYKITDQKTCPYCDGMYVPIVDIKCPHCGAPVK